MSEIASGTVVPAWRAAASGPARRRTSSAFLLGLLLGCGGSSGPPSAPAVPPSPAARAGSSASPAPATLRRPNVLLLVADDLNTSLGTYGHPLVKTPSIDAIARRGVRFDRAYCQYPLCNPTRASLLTGRRPDATGVLDNRTHFREALPDAVTLPQLFRQHGYTAASVGKITHADVPSDTGASTLHDPPSWDVAVHPSGGREDEVEGRIINYTAWEANLGAGLTWHVGEGNDDEHSDGMIATETIRLLDEYRERSFFLAVGFYRPHVPCVAPRRWFEMYPVEAVTLPAIPPSWGKDVPAAALTVRPASYGFREEPLRLMTRAYYASVSFMDAQVGRVLEALDRLELADDTIVVFLGDHGFHLGEQGQWGKMTLFEASARVPLVIAAPGLRAAGKASGRTVELVDVYPTIADLAGLTPPSDLEGTSLRPLLDDPDAPWTDPAYTQVVRPDGVAGRSVRTERYRYTEWDGGRAGVELYDHDVAPREDVNLASDPHRASAALAEMRRRLRDGAR